MEKAKSLLHEFVEFVRKYGVVGLAIGVVTGLAANDFVKVISDNLLSPVVKWIISLFGKETFNTLNIVVNKGAENEYTFGFGNVIIGLINFLAVMLFVFILVRFVINRFLTEEEKAKY